MKYIKFLLFFILILEAKFACPDFNNNIECEVGQNSNSEWDERCFQTPPRTDTSGNYKSTYQDMNYFMGYSQLKYNSDKTICTINFITKVNPILGTEGIDYKIYYKFGSTEQENNNSFTINNNNSYPNGFQISAKIIDINDSTKIIASLQLENEYFIWDNPTITLSDKYEDGQKGIIVELFGWPYDDIAEECDFLSVAGYLGVKIFPPNESILNTDFYDNDELNPWWYFFQPISYKLESRMGNKKQLKNMINKCRKKNVRIYSEVVINQMGGNGNDAYKVHFNNDCSDTWGARTGTAGSPFWTTKGQYENNQYTGLKPTFEFPSVPYCGSDFHCYSDVVYTDYNLLNFGWIDNLPDLNTEKEYVQQRIADFLTDLLSIGISGFSINNSKHISPLNFAYIFKRLRDNLGSTEFPQDFIAYLEIIVGNEKNIVLCPGSDNTYSFGENFVQLLKGQGLTDNDIYKIKIWTEDYPDKLPDCSTDNYAIDMKRHVISLENHNDISTDSTSSYSYQSIKNIDTHRNNYITMIRNSDNEWKIKLVFSAYSIINSGTGFPDGKSDCGNACYKSVPYVKAYEPLSTGYDTKEEANWIEGNYTRIHRDLQIVNAMRQWMSLETINDENLYKNEREKINSLKCEEKCLTCDEESNKNNLCLTCNMAKGYYPINYHYPNYNQKYLECLKYGINHNRFFFDSLNNEFKPCYETCATCEEEGFSLIHNCKTCETNYRFRPDNPISNCVTDCEYSYYISKFGQYKCTDYPQCPEESKFFIKARNKCTDDCKKDPLYKFQYNGDCLEKCPDNTENDNYLCKEKNYQKCTLSEKETELNNDNYVVGINTIAKTYSTEFSYTNNHVSQYKNNVYNIIIYKNNECINELSLDMPKIDFGDCYNKVKDTEKIQDNLIIAVVDIQSQNNPITSYSFYHPKTGQKLDAATICKDEVIIVEENIMTLLNENNSNYQSILLLASQNINVFNVSDEFYTDICYHFESPTDKDIPLKDRLLEFFPNITLCDTGCQNTGINFTSMSVICRCTFNDIANNDLIKDNILINNVVGEVLDIINESNIAVLKCYKYIFKYFSKSYGGFIILFLLLSHIILIFIFFFYDLNNIRKYIFNLTENYLIYLTEYNKTNIINQPPKKIIERNKKVTLNKNNSEENKASLYSDKNLNIKSTKNLAYNSKEKFIRPIISIKSKNTKKIFLESKLKNNKSKNEKKSKYESYFNNYLSTSVDDMDYDDAIKKENRDFCKYFFESIKEKQIIANTFINVNPIRTRSIKIMLFLLDILLFFFVNGLFFDEEYVSEVYNLETEETFFSFIPRSYSRFFYTTLVSGVIGFIIDCIFVEEKKIRGIFLREKDSSMTIKQEIVVFIKELKNRYLIFILIVIFFLMISFYYFLCFNYVYPHMQIEWIKSSILIMAIMQIVSIISILLESILRYASFSCKSEKLYKVSKLLT